MRRAELSVAPPPGREPDAAAIGRSLDGLGAGTGGVLVLSGDGGVGKTTLSSWATEEARAREVLVLEAPCFALSAQTPYAPLVAAFGPVVRGDHGIDPAELTTALSSLGLLFDELADADTAVGEQADPSLVRSRLHGALATLVSRLCARAPVLLAVDDLHWADDATIEVIHALTNDLPHAPLLVLATLRPFEGSERSETRQLLRALRPAAWTTTLEVGPLDLDATRALVQGRLGSVVSNRVVDLVQRRSGGTPLVAEELLELMIETGALRPVGRRWELRTDERVPVPAVADELIGDRLERLGPEAVRIVAAVALGAESVTTDLLSTVTSAPADRLRAQLEELRRSGVVDRTEVAGDTAWVVHHPIIGEVAVEMVDVSARSDLHRAYADGLPETAVERRGRHLLGVGSEVLRPDDLRVLVEAGRSALDRGAPAEACRLLATVLGTIDDRGIGAELLPEVLAGLGTGWTRRGELTVAVQHLERARRLARRDDAPVREALLVEAIQRTWWTGRSDVGTSVEDIDDLVGRLRAAGELAAAHRLLRSQVITEMRAGGLARIDDLLDGLARIEAQVDDPAVRRWGRYLRLLTSLERLDDAPGMVETLDDGFAGVTDDPTLHRRILHERLDLMLVLGTRHQIMEAIRDERRFDERWGDWPTWRVGIATWDVVMAEGDLDRAHEIEMLVPLGHNERPIGYVAVAAALTGLLTGHRPDAPVPTTPPDEDPVLHHLLQLASLLRGEGDRRAVARAVVDAFETRRYMAGIPLICAIGAGLAHLVLDDRSGVMEIGEILRRFDRGSGRASAWASVLEGEAARDRTARAGAYADAAERFAALDRPFDVAVCHLTAAEAGADVRRDDLDAAAELFEAAPAPWMSDRLAAVAGRAQVARRSRPSAVDHLGLTPREREVAEVVAEGLSNREVANRLYISVRTVTSHLDHIYTKLGISSRGELAALLTSDAAT